VFRGDGPFPRPDVAPGMIRELARKERAVAEVLADAEARELIRSGWRDMAGHDCNDAMKGLVLRFQAAGRRPPIAALQEFAQLVANQDDQLLVLLDDAEEQEG
jgi:hypothetical protein